jgi:hypothetical protein
MHKSKCKASQRRLRRPWGLSLRRKQRIKAAEQIQGKRYRHAAGAVAAAIALCKRRRISLLLLTHGYRSKAAEPACANKAARTNTTVSEMGYFFARAARQSRTNLDRDFAVDELAVVYPILNAIFDPIPIVAEKTDGFVRGRIG